MLAFALRDGFFRQPHAPGRSGFDLHKNRDIPLLRDDVDFTIWCAKILCDDSISSFEEVLNSSRFSPSADALVVFHRRNSSKIVRRRSSSFCLTGLVFWVR